MRILIRFIFIVGFIMGTLQGNPLSEAKEKISVDDKVNKTNKEWKKILTSEQYHITREKGTERAYSGKYHDHKGDGMYTCVACGLPLFDSKTKFDSRTGWPSYWEPVDEKHIKSKSDFALFMKRTEVLCNRCGAHLGHVFEDGPKPTGLRYCINSAALNFEKSEKE